MLLTLLQTRAAPVPDVPSRGGLGPERKRKQRDFDQERRDREALRKIIERALDPIKASEAEVVAIEESVAVLPKTGASIAIPIPPEFNAAEVTRMVMQALNSMQVEAQRVRTVKAQAEARKLHAQWLERQRKRRREEEWLLLMD
jgi:hypothetical protein